MRRIIAVIIILLIVITALMLTYVYIIQPGQIDKSVYNLDPFYKLAWAQNNQNNSVIQGADSLNITLTWKTVCIYDCYYSIDVPIIEDKFEEKPDEKIPLNLMPLNLAITSEKPLPNNLLEKTYQCNIELQNLTDGQHSITLYYSYYDPIITTWKHYKPGSTINFSIDTSTSPP
ncbi:MAG: hypothetical protein NWE95_12315 [Candidatus Bathyarchaeota archaeon]|nr:hypothetical protein [Candidatus Bathyarchaeota archaeon]